MGQPATVRVERGTVVRVATGGMVPEGADAVVMVEYTDSVDAHLLEIFRQAAPGEGLVQRGDDLHAGDLLLSAGRRLRPQDLGACAGVGVVSLPVYRRPRVAVIPSGDEIVPPARDPTPGQVRDINTDALAAAVREAGAVPHCFPVVPDEPEALKSTVQAALDTTDLILIAGGSSVGARDWTLEVLTALPGAELLLHGVAIRPGKPVIVVAMGDRLLVGLPGNPVSALIVFDQFIRPYLRRLSGEKRLLPEGARVSARLSRNCASDAGKEDYVRVRLHEGPAGYEAEPLLGKSTLMMTLVGADGIVVIPENVEGLEAGEPVEVQLF
jgi:molybdopterin molybdotransferase